MKAATPRPAEPLQRMRCAIYTRKSTDENLESDFNSLDAQREAAESYIQSQKHAGWVALEARYDDPAFSAATTDRPGLQRLLEDVERGQIDAVVVYKIDRLSRSLRDFGHLMETFERHGVSFVSVTQRFDTSSSMGKLTLNILMSFAEFEREVTRERIRDRMAAAKRKGKHTGGMPVLGYDTDRVMKRLVVNAEEAKLVRRIFQRFVDLGSAAALLAELNRDGHRTKAWTTAKGIVRGGTPWNKAHLYHALNNPRYLGLVEHHGERYPGEHEAIVPQELWDEAHRILEANHRARANRTRAKTPALLRGLIFCKHCGHAMGPTFSQRRGRTYRYYLCVGAAKRGYATCPVRSVAAGEVERAVVDQLRAVFRTPEVVARTYREAKAREAEEIQRLRGEMAELERRTDDAEARCRLAAAVGDLRALEAQALTEREVIDALERLDPVWEELFPAEQARIVGLLVERVDVEPEGLEVRLRAGGLRSLVAELTEARWGTEGR